MALSVIKRAGNRADAVQAGKRLPRPIISSDDGLEVILSLVGLLLNDRGGYGCGERFKQIRSAEKRGVSR